MGALLVFIVCGNGFSIIALIGIVLLIGIVKKNAIMMIDFALDAKYKEGMTPRRRSTRPLCSGFRPIMMTTMAALLGGVTAGAWHGAARSWRQALGITIYWRTDPQPDFDALHDAGHLPLFDRLARQILEKRRQRGTPELRWNSQCPQSSPS